MLQYLKVLLNTTVRITRKNLRLFADKATAYSAVPSALDYTTGVVPVTFADQFLDYEPFAYTPISDRDRVNWRLCE